MKRFLASLLFFWLSAVAAQPFPAKPVKIIVAFPPGGGTDIVARLLGARAAAARRHPDAIGAAR